MSKKTNEIRERIQIAEEKRGRELTEKEKQKIEKNVILKYRRKNFIRGGIAAIVSALGIGGVAGSTITKRLEEAKNDRVSQNNEKITVNTLDYSGDININGVQTNKEIFLNGIKVTVDDVKAIEEQKTEEEKIRAEVEKDIDNLKNEEDVLNYIKKFYVDEFNKKNNTEITVDNVRFDRTRIADIFISKAQNGDEILTFNKTERQLNGIETNKGVTTAKIIQDETLINIESAMEHGNEYVPVYRNTENIEARGENILSKDSLYAVITSGIDYYDKVKNNENDSKEQYKNKFVNAVTEYTQQQEKIEEYEK